MPALNFKKQFAPKVESGEKRQSIRAKRRDGRNPRPGQMLYHYTGMRTKGCRKLREGQCLSVQEIILDWRLGIYIDGIWLGEIERNEFAKADGFKGFTAWQDMRDFFARVHGLSETEQFHGLLIKW
jgi:hypothetical protein